MFWRNFFFPVGLKKDIENLSKIHIEEAKILKQWKIHPETLGGELVNSIGR